MHTPVCTCCHMLLMLWPSHAERPGPVLLDIDVAYFKKYAALRQWNGESFLYRSSWGCWFRATAGLFSSSVPPHQASLPPASTTHPPAPDAQCNGSRRSLVETPADQPPNRSHKVTEVWGGIKTCRRQAADAVVRRCRSRLPCWRAHVTGTNLSHRAPSVTWSREWVNKRPTKPQPPFIMIKKIIYWDFFLH